MKKVFLTIAAFAFATTLFAQANLKIGHINSQELLMAIPENDSAKVKLEKATMLLQKDLQTMQAEYTEKQQDFEKKQGTYSELMKQTKTAELQTAQQSLQKFQQSAEQSLQTQRSDLYKPIIDKVNKAIADVAKENGFTYIIDLAQGGIIYHAESSIDILPKVKQKLGLPEKPKAAEAKVPAKK